MTYIDGCVIAVPTAKKEQFLEHAKFAAEIFKDHGASGTVETWGDDVPDGEVTSFPMAVKCKEDETVCLSWIVWPSKEVRDTGWAAAMQDPRFEEDRLPIPFDGKRMIYGGFQMILET